MKRKGINGPHPKRCERCRKKQKAEASHRATQRRFERDPEYRKVHRSRAAARTKRYREADPEKYRALERARKKERWANDPEWRERQMDYRRKRVYGLDLGAFARMVEEQGGKCAICGDAPERLHIDHDHACCDRKGSCGSCLRGLICEWCNQGLGRFKDDPAALRAAADYLEKFR